MLNIHMTSVKTTELKISCLKGTRPLSYFDWGGSGPMASFEDAKKSGTPDCQTGGQIAQDEIFDEFCADHETIAALGVTAIELRELSRASLLGTLTCKEDVLFMLHQIREALKPAEQQSNQPSIAHMNMLAEKIRNEALLKLEELELKAAQRRESARGRFDAACERFMMVLDRAQSFITRLSYKLDRRSVGSRST